MIENTITEKKLKKYFEITGEAIREAEESGNRLGMREARDDFLDMIKRYYADARFFYDKEDFVNAFAALNYAHGWLDAGARIGLFDVHNSRLFTVD